MQSTTEGLLLVRDIQERGYAEFEHGISCEEIELLVERYGTFTTEHPDPSFETMDAMLPTAPLMNDLENPEYHDESGHFKVEYWIAKKLDDLDRTQNTASIWNKYMSNTQGVAKPNGYSNRSFQMKALSATRQLTIIDDPKEFYHFYPGHYADMARVHKEMDLPSIPPEVDRLNAAFGPIHQKAKDLIIRICGIVEETHPEISRFISPRVLRTSPVRLLFYHPDENPIYGAGHYDKGAMTLQLAESHRGLRIAPNSEECLEDVVRSADKAAFFPSLAISDRYPDTPYQAGWHDIVRTGLLNDGRSVPPEAAQVCARWALIFFANYENFVQPDKMLTHTR